MDALDLLDRRASRFVEQHWSTVRLGTLAVLGGLLLGAVAATVLFGPGAALRAGALAATGMLALTGLAVLLAHVVVPDELGRHRGTRS